MMSRLWAIEECQALEDELAASEPAYTWTAMQRVHDCFDHDDDSLWIRCRDGDLVMASSWDQDDLRSRTPELVRAIADVFRRQIVAERVVRAVEGAPTRE